MCAECGTLGAIQRCARCQQTVYCGAACQKRHWRGGHKHACRERAHVSTIGGSGSGSSALDGGGSNSEKEPINPCPICLCNEDDSGECGMCGECGQLICGECTGTIGIGTAVDNCPICRSPYAVSDETCFKLTWNMVHDRTPGRHTPIAQYQLGVMYKRGRGVGQDVAEAARWYRKAAEQGLAHAQYDFGVLCAKGTGVGQDDAEAVRWFREAANQQHAAAQFDLGLHYLLGEGIGQDDTEAIRLFRKAADQGQAGAQLNLGLMYARGKGTPADMRPAVEWWCKAAAQGNTHATAMLQGIPRFPLEMVGVPVVVIGLTASPHLNGRTGIVQGPAANPERLLVLLDGEAKPMSLRERNLRKADGF